ncbi:MAG TPA: hypothetical protein VJ808_08710, partial [Gemmatimonadales bacterium]|nr:hypothetical protein [Gemmatimonadales bacterium]
MRVQLNLLGLVLYAQILPSGAAAAQTPNDSSFLLHTADVRRSPSPFIGNGRIGVVIPPLGIGAAPSYKAGLYEHGTDDVPRIVAMPAWNGIGIFDGHDWITPHPAPDGSVRRYDQVLDMRSGTVRTSYDWVNGGARTGIRVEQFVSRADPSLAVSRLEVIPQQAGRMRVRFALTGWPPPERLPLARLPRADPSWKPGDIWYPGHMVVRSRESRRDRSGARLEMTSTPVGRTTVLGQVAAITWGMNLRNPVTSTIASGDTALVEIGFDASAGRTYTFSQLVSSVSSDEAQQPLEQARREVEAGRARGFDRLVRDNARAWLRRWETDIEVEGNPELQRVVRSMLFYLLCSAGSGTKLGIPPMGLSSAGYYGHIFWDSDTWMFPPLLLTHPDIAHSLVAFRTRTLAAARENAKLNGFRGAMYPWEADERGVETTPHFAVQNARSEIHVNGDVALAQWQYYLATADSGWLAAEGFPVIRETADFWVSRAVCEPSDERCHIENVVSVAEGLIGVTD